MSTTRQARHRCPIVITVAIVVFMAVGGALFALALMLVLAWTLARLLRERDAQLSSGFWWKLTLSGVGVFAAGMLFFAGPWPQSWRDAVPGELGWWSGMFIFCTAIVMIVAGVLSGVVRVRGHGDASATDEVRRAVAARARRPHPRSRAAPCGGGWLRWRCRCAGSSTACGAASSRGCTAGSRS